MIPRAFFALTLAGLVVGCGAPPTWTTPVSNQNGVLLSVWGSSPTDVWTVGGTCDLTDCKNTSKSLVLRFDGKSWTKVDAGVNVVLWWVFGFSKDDVWIAGEQGTLLHWDGKTFTRAAEGLAPDAKLYGVWGSSPRDLWAVGGKPDESAVVLRGDGTSWRKDAAAPAVTDGRLGGTWFKVWGAAPDAVYLVGQLGFLVRFDGAKYERVDLAGAGVTAQGLFTVAGRARDDIYAVGGDPGRGLALHFDGKTWGKVKNLDLSLAQLLMGVHVSPAGDAIITGMGGAKFRRRAGQVAWLDESTLPPTSDLHAAFVFGPEDVFAAGGSFFTLQRGTVGHFGPPIAAAAN